MFVHPPPGTEGGLDIATTLIDKISIEAAQRLRANGGNIMPLGETGRYALIAPPSCRWSGSKVHPLMRLPDGSKIRLILHDEMAEVIAI